MPRSDTTGLFLLDPFDVVRYDSNRSPDSRTLHTTLFEKVKDTFWVIHGGTTYDTRTFNTLRDEDTNVYRRASSDATPPKPIRNFFAVPPGLFDYATLGIFKAINHATNYLRDLRDTKKNHDKKLIAALISIPYGFFAVLNLLGNGLLRGLVSAVLTIACLPITILSHAIARVVRRLERGELANNLNVTTKQVGTENFTTAKLATIMHANKVSFSDISLDNHYADRNDTAVEFYKHTPEGATAIGALRLQHNGEIHSKLVKLFPELREYQEDRGESDKPRHRI